MKFVCLMCKWPVVAFFTGGGDAVRASFLSMALCVFICVDFSMSVAYGAGMA